MSIISHICCLVLTNIFFNNRITNGFMPYLISLWNEVEFFHTGACLDLTEECCEIENVLPTKIISYMITNSHFDELYVLLKIISRTNGITPVEQKHNRLMVKLTENDDIFMPDDIKHSQLNTKIFLKQISTMLSNLSLSQQAQGSTQAELINTQQTLSDTQHELNNKKLELGNTQQALNNAQQAFHDTQEALSVSQQTLGEYHQALSDTQQALSDTQQALSDPQHELSNTQHELNNTQQEKTELDNANAVLISEVHNLMHSTSWQISKPLRGMRRLLSKH